MRRSAQAQQRDCVVLVTWTGDADIDSGGRRAGGHGRFAAAAAIDQRRRAPGRCVGGRTARARRRALPRPTSARKGLTASIAC